MNKTIEFIKKYWKTITIGLCIGLMVTITMCGNANWRSNQQTLFLTELINAKETLRDSMELVKNLELLILSDSIQKVEKKKSDIATKRANEWHTKVNKLDKLNKELKLNVDSLLAERGDSLSTDCKEVVGVLIELNEGLVELIDALNEEINELNLVVDADSTGWEACKEGNVALTNMVVSKIDLLVVKENLIIDLKKELNKLNGWLNKNKGWIGLGVGIVGGILIIK